MTNTIIVSRLLEHVDPWGPLNLTPIPTLDEVEKAERQGYLEIDERGDAWEGKRRAWDVGRIATFVDQLRAGDVLDPILLDNVCENGRIYPQTVLRDGHHRLCAAALIGHETLTAEYGGLVNVLEWLEGKRDTCPEEL